MQKLNRLTEVLVLATVAWLGHPDTASAQLVYTPATLDFTITGPGGSAASQTVTLTSSSGAVNCNAISSISTPGVNPAWLSASCSGNTVTVSIVASATAALSINTNYSGSVSLNTGSISGAPLQVNLHIGGSSSGGTGGLVANPSSVTFGLAAPLTSGQSGPAQTITVTYNGGSPGGISTNFTPGNTFGGVVFVNTSVNSAAAQVTLTVNSAATQVGTYTGILTISAPSLPAGSNTINVAVTLNIGGTGAGLVVNPTSLSFTAQVGGTPLAQNVSVTVNGSPATISNVIATSSPAGWLLPSIPSTVGTVNVGISTAGLSAGSYNGSVSIVTTQGNLTLPVGLTVGGLPTLTVNPSGINFAYQSGTSNPLPQTIAVASSGNNVTFTATPTISSGGTQWLVVSPSGQTTVTPSTLTVSVNPAGLAAGTTYTGNIRIDTFGASTNTTTNVPVSLLVSSNPILTVSPTALTFTAQVGLNPAPQTLSLTSSSAIVGYTVASTVTTPTGGNWLQVPSQNGSTPGSLNVTINTQGLAAGTYTGTINFTSPTAGNGSLSVPVTLTVSAGSILTVSPTSLSFAYQTGQVPPLNQAVTVNTSGSQNVAFSVTSQILSGPAGWLSITGASAVAPGNFVVGINTTGLTPGTYNATITVTPSGAATGLSVPVTLVVSNTALLVVSPGGITFTAPANSATATPAFQNVAVTSTDNSAIIFSSSATTAVAGQSWLLVTQPTGPTNSNLTVTANPTGLAVGTYTGSVTVTATNPTIANSPQTIPVTLNITPTSTLSATPTALTFNQAAGGPAPAAQTVSVTGIGGNITFSAVASTNQGGSSWLTVNPSNATTPASLSVSANGSGLNAGTYTGSILISSPGSQNNQIISVQLIISNAVNIVASPTALAPVSFQIGSANPQPQTISISLGTGGTSAFTAAATMSTGTGWLAVSPTSGNTPANLTVTVTPGSLTPGTYTGAISITVGGASNSPLSLPITLTVTPAPVITPTVGSVQNAASYAFSAISPGMNVYIQGTNMGPGTLTTYHVGANGTLDSTVAETTVTFDGLPAPIIYTSSTQVSVMVPYGVAGRGRVNMIVTYKNVSSIPFGINVTDVSPGLYTLNSTSTTAGNGTGQGAILNQNLTINSPSNPEQVGRYIAIYATGEGLTTPRSTDGAITPNRLPLPVPSAAVTVTIGGILVPAADVVYAGEAPSSVAGQIQVNAKIPDTLSAGPQPVFITVGGVPSQAGVVVQVRR